MGKKKNEIIEEQRKAREEFLKLKKMQRGEIKAPPKPSEVAILPKTKKEKAKNFWYQYKVHIISAVLAVAMLVLFVTQCASRESHDLKIVYFSYTPVLDSQIESIADYYEKVIDDINNDGQRNIQIINCSFSNTSAGYQYKNAMITKLQGIMASDDKALLFITDNKSIKYFENISDEDVFTQEPVVFGEKFYSEVAPELSQARRLQISCRRIDGIAIEDSKNIKAVFEESQKILECSKEN